MNATQRITILLVLICSFCVIMSVGMITVASAQEAPQNTTTAADDSGASSDEEKSIDTSTTQVTVDHVTIHDIRWYPDRVEIDYTAQRDDTVRITDFKGDRFYWQDYDVQAGETGTISHSFRGDSGYISFAVESAQEGIELQEDGAAYTAPSIGELAAMAIGLIMPFVGMVGLKLRDDRLHSNKPRRLF